MRKRYTVYLYVPLCTMCEIIMYVNQNCYSVVRFQVVTTCSQGCEQVVTTWNAHYVD